MNPLEPSSPILYENPLFQRKKRSLDDQAVQGSLSKRPSLEPKESRSASFKRKLSSGDEFALSPRPSAPPLCLADKATIEEYIKTPSDRVALARQEEEYKAQRVSELTDSLQELSVGTGNVDAKKPRTLYTLV